MTETGDLPGERGANARSTELRRLALEGELERLRERVAELERAVADERAGAARGNREVASLRADLERTRRSELERRRALEQALTTATVALRSVREDIERVETSAAWRMGHRAARTAGTLRGRAPKGSGAVAAARRRIEEAIEALSRQRGEADDRISIGHTNGSIRAGTSPPVKRELSDRLRAVLGTPVDHSWPGVSIVLPSREAPDALSPLLHGLRYTDYPELELIICDRGTGAELDQLVKRIRLPFPAQVRRDPDLTLLAACNAAVQQASHPLLLLLDEGLEPFDPEWLKELVDGLVASDADVIAPTLIRGADTSEVDGPHEFVIAQRGVRFARNGEGPRLVPVDPGVPLRDDELGRETASPVLTPACMLLRREMFTDAGGFDQGYLYEFAAVNLSLWLTRYGARLSCSGRSLALYGDRSSRAIERLASPAARTLGERRLAESWGPAIRRELRLAAARGDRQWGGDEPIRVTVVLPRVAEEDKRVGHELAGALDAAGWTATALEPTREQWPPSAADADVVVVLDPDFDIGGLPRSATAVGWILGDVPRWVESTQADRCDVLLAASHSAVRAVKAATGREPVLFPRATNPDTFALAEPQDRLRAHYAIVRDRAAALPGIEDALVPQDSEWAAIYGAGWDEVERLRDYVRGEVSPEMLPTIYSSARVLIDDAHERADDAGVSASVFDALAAGAEVLTNNGGPARELFDKRFPVWSDPTELRSKLETMSTGGVLRRGARTRYRRDVLARHTYGHRASELRQLVMATDELPSFCIKVGAPDWERATRWGDLYLARDLERALRRRGHRCLVQVLPEWDDLVGFDYDVVVHIRGRSRYYPRPGQFNVLWLISHPTELEDEEGDWFDVVCVASERYARDLGERISQPVAVLDQATDPWRFFPDPSAEFAHDLAFVGNSRGDRRHILDDLLPTDHDLAIWGSGLPQNAREHVKGDWIANDQLRRVYSSAKLVLCDHWEDMRAAGFASNRLYDAVASGAVVVSDAVAGLGDRFGDAVVTYTDRDDLRATVARLLADDDERTQRAAGARERLLRAHTFDHRVSDLLALIEEHADASSWRPRVAAA